MKLILFYSFLFYSTLTIHSNTIIVDINGSGDYTSIQPAINAASVGDTVKIMPGVYDSAISLTKNIVVLGSGYEYTKITSSSNPTLTMSAGKIMWVTINSIGGDGINLKGGLVQNAAIIGCTGNGIYSTEGSSTVSNCVIVNNTQYGMRTQGYDTDLYVTNCISYFNGLNDFKGGSGDLFLSYSDGEAVDVIEGTGCINQDPKFISDTDLHLQLNSPCIDTGNTSMNDPDGTRSDMGYFGGEECPIYPIVTQIKIIAQPNGEIQIQAIGQANY